MQQLRSMTVLDESASVQQQGVDLDDYLLHNDNPLPEPSGHLPRPDVKVISIWHALLSPCV